MKEIFTTKEEIHPVTGKVFMMTLTPVEPKESTVVLAAKRELENLMAVAERNGLSKDQNNRAKALMKIVFNKKA